MIQICDADIARAEELLLPPGCCFNEERRDYIKCMESRDVVACPGSGKTTALLAKLLILARAMPLPANRGVCVLTHTNIAIDEIKKRAGSAADALFTHPNFFGTIQTFVNRFLAIPAYRIIYNAPLVSIDNDRFYAAIRVRYDRDPALQMWLEPRGGVGALGAYWLKAPDLSVGKDLDNDIPRLSRSKPTYARIERLRNGVLKQGILSYNDAYSLGLYYLQRFPLVAKALRHRFCMVFVDEMQDTDDHQLRILKRLFAGEQNVIMQCLGDPNQAIYQSDVNQKLLWTPAEPVLPFSDSLRYGKSIAKVLDTVRVDRTLTLEPNELQNSLPPHMILFDSGNEAAVLPEFASLIREYGLHTIPDRKFHAVGWVGKDRTVENKACLRTYCENYLMQQAVARSQWLPTLMSYAHTMVLQSKKDLVQSRCLSEAAFAGIVRALHESGIRHPVTNRSFTITSLKNHLKQTNEDEYDSLRSAVSRWVLALVRGQLTVEELRDTISTFFQNNLGIAEGHNSSDFMASHSVMSALPELLSGNTFVSDTGDVIEVGTVHGIKGQTHTATLYLETFNRKLDSERILPFCLGQYPKADSKKVHHRENLKVAHVAFSRPTHLLAFACCSGNVAGMESEFEDAGWVLRKAIVEERI